MVLSGTPVRCAICLGSASPSIAAQIRRRSTVVMNLESSFSSRSPFAKMRTFEIFFSSDRTSPFSM